MEQGREYTALTDNMLTPLLGKSQETQKTTQQGKEKVDLDAIQEIAVVQTTIDRPQRNLTKSDNYRDFDKTFGGSSFGEKIDICEQKEK